MFLFFTQILHKLMVFIMKFTFFINWIYPMWPNWILNSTVATHHHLNHCPLPMEYILRNSCHTTQHHLIQSPHWRCPVEVPKQHLHLSICGYERWPKHPSACISFCICCLLLCVLAFNLVHFYWCIYFCQFFICIIYSHLCKTAPSHNQFTVVISE